MYFQFPWSKESVAPDGVLGLASKDSYKKNILMAVPWSRSAVHI